MNSPWQHLCRRNRIRHLPSMAIAILTLAGCAELPATAWKQMSSAKRDFDNKNYTAANKKLGTILTKYPEHPDSAEAYYLRAQCNIRLSNKVAAESDARHCLAVSKQSEISTRAHATLATLLFEANRTRDALPHFEVALKKMPEKPPADLLRYRHGLCLQREGQWNKARLEFATVFQHYPNATVAQHARRLYNWTHDFYSIQCGAFREKKSALKLNNLLSRSGLRSRVESRTRSGELLYVVYVGKYSRYGQARDALPSVQRQASDALVVP